MIRVMRGLGNRFWPRAVLVCIFAGLWLAAIFPLHAATGSPWSATFPRALSSYAEPEGASVWDILRERIHGEPFNLVATVLFGFAIIHTFLAAAFLKCSHRLEERHRERLADKPKSGTAGSRQEVSFLAVLFHFLGEVEVVFGIWVVPLLIAIAVNKGWNVARDYLGQGLNFTEPLFVVVIMVIAASRPILKLTEHAMSVVASLGKSNPIAWWLSILTIGPILGSFITEPAAMTICALLLGEKFYELRPSTKLAYATLGLLFVDISVGGLLSPFAAPPVLMVAGHWSWDLQHMLMHFGWKAVLGIIVSNLVYAVWFRREFQGLTGKATHQRTVSALEAAADQPVPFWVTLVHLLFLGWTVLNAHFPSLFIGGFLFYLAFLSATEHHQNELALRPALLVGFFLAGLVVHGGLQGWWIGPILSRLSEVPLFFGATILTAFNDNAAITYLAAQVPNLSDTLKYAVVAGAVAGGGLTVIANAPNPAGQSILSRFFPDGIAAGRLLLGALIPTAIVMAAFLVLK